MTVSTSVFHFLSKRPSYKHARHLQILKMSVALISFSVVVMFYGQYLLHTRCDALMCSDEKRVEIDTTNFASGREKDLFIQQIVDQEQEEVDTDATNEILARHRQPWIQDDTWPKKDVNDQPLETTSTTKGNTEGFKYEPVFDPPEKEPTLVSKQLVNWFRDMSNTEMTPPPNQSPVDPGAKEFLFPCSQDEYTISKALQVSHYRSGRVSVNIVLSPQEKVAEGDNLSGKGSVEFAEESLCRSLNIQKVTGEFKDGKLVGQGLVEFVDGSFMTAPFVHGVLHGMVRKFRCRFGDCDFFDYAPWSEPKYLWEISWYNNGIRVDTAWEFKIGGGVIVGQVDDSGHLSGQQVAYLYPDKITAIVGQFEKGQLVAGKESRLLGLNISRPIAVPSFVDPRGPIFTYEPSNKTHMVSSEFSLHLRDPYEEHYLRVGPSTIQQAGQGVFLKRDAPMGTIVGFYNGVRMSDLESKLRKADRKSPYRMDNDWAKEKEVLNVPEGFREPHQYNATFGHLINHNKEPNAWYAMIDHPRFGKIRSVVLKKDLKEGDEIFCDYGFLEQYMQSEELFKTILDVGQVFVGSEDKEDFHKEMKYTVKYLKHKVNEWQPYMNMFKSLYNMMN